ncbi:MAG: hypothetical protein R3F28_11735 [Candidatus Kapaibacterium sp.]
MDMLKIEEAKDSQNESGALPETDNEIDKTQEKSLLEEYKELLDEYKKLLIVKDEEESYSEWHARRLPTLSLLSLLYLIVVIAFPVLFSPPTAGSQQFSGLGCNAYWLVPVILGLLAIGTYWAMWKSQLFGEPSSKEELSSKEEPSSTKNKRVFAPVDTPLLLLVTLFYSILLTFTLPWKSWSYWVALSFLSATLLLLVLLNYHKQVEKKSVREKKSGEKKSKEPIIQPAILLYLVGLFVFGFWMLPPHGFNPKNFRQADSVVVKDSSSVTTFSQAFSRNRVDTTLRKVEDIYAKKVDSLTQVLRDSLPEDERFYSSRKGEEVLRELRKNFIRQIKNQIPTDSTSSADSISRKKLLDTLDLLIDVDVDRLTDSVYAVVRGLNPSIILSQEKKNEFDRSCDSFMLWKQYGEQIQERERAREAKEFAFNFRQHLVADNALLIKIMRVIQWRGLFFLIAIIFSLLCFHYQCRRMGIGNNDSKNRVKREWLDYRIAVSDAWLVILILLALPLAMPADKVPTGAYGTLRLAQWFLPNVDELTYEVPQEESRQRVWFDTLYVQVLNTNGRIGSDIEGMQESFKQILERLKGLNTHNQNFQIPILRWLYENVSVPQSNVRKMNIENIRKSQDSL